MSSSAWKNTWQQRERKIIGWDEILEGGLALSATVMSWRGGRRRYRCCIHEPYGHHDSGGNGMYLDAYQGDSKIEPVTIGGYTTLVGRLTATTRYPTHWLPWVKVIMYWVR